MLLRLYAIAAGQIKPLSCGRCFGRRKATNEWPMVAKCSKGGKNNGAGVQDDGPEGNSEEDYQRSKQTGADAHAAEDMRQQGSAVSWLQQSLMHQNIVSAHRTTPTSSVQRLAKPQKMQRVGVAHARKRRERRTPEQLHTLKHVFNNETHFPCKSKIEELADSLGMTAAQVGSWFRSRRQKLAKQANSHSPASSAQPPQNDMFPSGMNDGGRGISQDSEMHAHELQQDRKQGSTARRRQLAKQRYVNKRKRQWSVNDVGMQRQWQRDAFSSASATPIAQLVLEERETQPVEQRHQLFREFPSFCMQDKQNLRALMSGQAQVSIPDTDPQGFGAFLNDTQHG